MRRQRHRERVADANERFRLAEAIAKIEGDLQQCAEGLLVGDRQPARTLNAAGQEWHLVPGEDPDVRELVYVAFA